MKWDKSEAAIDKLCAQLQGFLANDEIVAEAGAVVMRMYGDLLQTYTCDIYGDYANVEFTAWDGQTMTIAVDLALARLDNPVSYVAREFCFMAMLFKDGKKDRRGGNKP